MWRTMKYTVEYVEFDNGEWQSIADLDEEITKSKEYAKNTFVKNQSCRRRFTVSNIGFQYHS